MNLRVIFRDGRMVEGIVDALDTQQITLREARGSLGDAKPCFYEKLVVKGSDLVDLEVFDPEDDRHSDNSHVPPFPCFYLQDKTPIPILTHSQISHVFNDSSTKYGPNMAQLIENGARSLVELVQHEYPVIFEHSGTALFLCEPGLFGGIAMALARHLSNRGVECTVWLNRKQGLQKYVEFQRLVASLHSVVIMDDPSLLAQHPPFLANQFSLVFDAFSSFETEEIELKKMLKKWIQRVQVPIVSFYAPSRVLIDLRIAPTSVVSFGMPSEQVSQAPGFDTAAIQRPRLFLVDVGISPRLWTKLDVCSSDIDLLSLYRSSGFVELFLQ